MVCLSMWHVFAQLFIFQVYCFQTKISDKGELTTTNLLNNVKSAGTSTPSPRCLSDGDDLTVSKDVLGKRKDRSTLERISSNAISPKDLTLGIDVLPSRKKLANNIIDLNSFPMDMDEQIVPESPLTSEAQIFHENLSNDRWVNQNQYSKERESSSNRFSSHMASADPSKTKSPTAYLNVDNSFGLLSPERGMSLISHRQSEDYPHIVSSRADPQPKTRQEISMMDNHDLTHRESLTKAVTRKPRSGRSHFSALEIFGMIGSFHLAGSPLLVEIRSWFEQLRRDMYLKKADSQEWRNTVDLFIARARDDMTVGFLGCLKVFEYQKPQWSDLSVLFLNGWDFMKSILDQWINLEWKLIDHNNEGPFKSELSHLRKLQSQKRVSKVLIEELHKDWDQTISKSNDRWKIERIHKDFLTLLNILEVKITDKAFYKMICINDHQSLSYLRRISSDCAKDLPKSWRLHK
ncbi:hypothetical protein DFH28DRAFT_1216108 [Melampsora americana]|nr:hypothetical protein DFH28DRAFT_1216108 [Melampsora americana]